MRLFASESSFDGGDFEEVLQRVKSRDFVYLDPPYAKARGRFRGEYGYNSFT